jgi:hypothetical protein
MLRKSKLAAAMLVLVILAMPLFAAANCFSGQSPMMHCPAGCPMMASATTACALQLSAHHPGGSCCDVSQGKPSAVAVPTAPVIFALAAPQASSVIAGLVPPVLRTQRQQSHPLRFFDSSQSLLCTLLI